MPARARRDELIALVVLVALAIAIAGILAIIEPSANPLGDDPQPASSETAVPEAAPDDAGVRLWDQPFVYACRVLPTADVERIFGPSGPRGYVRQQYLDRTPTTEELDGATAFAYGGLGTRCTHWFDDEAGHSLDVVVTQFPSADEVDRRWRQLARTGRPVPGTDDRLLYLPGSGSFVLRTGSLVVEAHYSADETIPRDRQVPLMQEVVTAVDLDAATGRRSAGRCRSTESVPPARSVGRLNVEPCARLRLRPSSRSAARSRSGRCLRVGEAA